MLKRITLLAVAVLCLTSTSYAQQAPGKFRITGFVTNPGYTESDFSGSNFTGALGVGAEYFFAPRVSASVQVSTETYTESVLTVYDPANGTILFDTRSKRTYPVDLLARYHFKGNDRWKPYVGGGVSMVSASRQSSYFPGDIESHTDWHAGVEIDGGVTFQLTPSLGLDLEVKHALEDAPFTSWDQTRGSIGVSWRF
jgi:opacity protein-like surface antigen